MAQLTARFWVDAYLARLRLEDIAGFVVSHGDDIAGSVLVKSNTLDGSARLYQRSYSLLEDRREWAVLAEGDEGEVDATIKRQLEVDRDLWVIEVEDRSGRHLLDAPGLS